MAQYTLDLAYPLDGFGPPVSLQPDQPGDTACASGLRRPGWGIPPGGSTGTVSVDEPAMASDGERGTASGVRHGVSVLPGHGCFRTVPEFSPQWPGRRLRLTRAKVLLVGLAVLALGGLGYVGFNAAGFEGFSAGIAAQSVLILIVLVWTASYATRVITGQMTFMEQRRRYRKVYDEQAKDDLQARFDSMPEAEQQQLLRRIGMQPEDTPLDP